MSRDIQSELWVGVEIDKISNTALSNFIADIDNYTRETPREELVEVAVDQIQNYEDELQVSICYDGEEDDEKIIGFIIPKTTCELYVKPLDLVQIQSYSDSKKEYLLKTFGVEPKIYLVPQYL